MNNQTNPLDEIRKRQYELDDLIKRANQAKIERDELDQAYQTLSKYIPSFASSQVNKNIASAVESEKSVQSSVKSLRAAVQELFNTSTPLSIKEVTSLILPKGYDTNRATVNSTLHTLVKRGYLEKVSIGIYRKSEKISTKSIES
jgi:Fic family protein